MGRKGEGGQSSTKFERRIKVIEGLGSGGCRVYYIRCRTRDDLFVDSRVRTSVCKTESFRKTLSPLFSEIFPNKSGSWYRARKLGSSDPPVLPA